MILSTVNGLAHLHLPINSYKGKPALAHCDLKSKNILVKLNLTCCIGDLGMAICGDRHGKVQLAPGTVLRTGTKRYLAPEILDKTMDQSVLKNFQLAELYSLGLVTWEVLRACQFESAKQPGVVYAPLDHELPYYEYMPVGSDPDEALMRNIVCEKKLRPTVAPQWSEHSITRGLSALTQELWSDRVNERDEPLRMKKTIMKIIEVATSFPQQHQPQLL
jgi:bone morphogenetic protein receptor type-1B